MTAPWWPGQICANWTLHAAGLLLPAALLLCRRPAAGLALIVLLALACAPWIGAARAARAPAPLAGQPALRVVSANVAAWNQQRSSAIAAAARTDPDLLCVIEVRASDEEDYRGDPRWPHQLWAQNPTGIGLLSRLPIVERLILPATVNPMLEAIIEVNGRRLRVIAAHTTSPTSPARQRARARELTMIARLAHQDELPVLMLGDLNLSVADPEFNGFCAAGGLLRPAIEPATWPSLLGPFAIGIDHILVRGLTLGGEHALWLPGSDHRGLLAQVGLPP